MREATGRRGGECWFTDCWLWKKPSTNPRILLIMHSCIIWKKCTDAFYQLMNHETLKMALTSGHLQGERNAMTYQTRLATPEEVLIQCQTCLLTVTLFFCYSNLQESEIRPGKLIFSSFKNNLNAFSCPSCLGVMVLRTSCINYCLWLDHCCAWIPMQYSNNPDITARLLFSSLMSHLTFLASPNCWGVTVT